MTPFFRLHARAFRYLYLNEIILSWYAEALRVNYSVGQCNDKIVVVY